VYAAGKQDYLAQVFQDHVGHPAGGPYPEVLGSINALSRWVTAGANYKPTPAILAAECANAAVVIGGIFEIQTAAYEPASFWTIVPAQGRRHLVDHMLDENN